MMRGARLPWSLDARVAGTDGMVGGWDVGDVMDGHGWRVVNGA